MSDYPMLTDEQIDDIDDELGRRAPSYFECKQLVEMARFSLRAAAEWQGADGKADALQRDLASATLASATLAASVENLTADLKRAEQRLAEVTAQADAANSIVRDDYNEMKALRTERDSAIRERDEANAALDELMTKVPVGSFAGPSVALVELMRKRYAREAEQWKANHEQRKQERDEAMALNARMRTAATEVFQRLLRSDDADQWEMSSMLDIDNDLPLPKDPTP